MFSMVKKVVAVVLFSIAGIIVNASEPRYDYTPDDIDFKDGSGEYCYTSNVVKITGINTILSLSIMGEDNYERARYAGEFFYSVDGQEFIAATVAESNDGFQYFYDEVELENGQTLQLRYCNADDRVGGYIYVSIYNMNAAKVLDTVTFKAGAP